MGILDTVADVASGVADAAPIPGSDIVASGIDAAQSALGGGNGNGGGQPQAMTPAQRGQGQFRTRGGPMRNAPTLGGGTRGPGRRTTRPSDPPEGIRSGGSLNLPGLPSVGGGFSLTSPPTSPPSGQQQATGQQQTGGGQMMASGNLPQLLFAEMMDDAMSASSDVQRYFLESLQSGSIQNGFFTTPTKVKTPRGVEYHSPPGYRTVTINGQKVSVHGAVAKMMNLLPKGERTFREKADDAAREYLTMRRKWKDLASKFGFKSPKARKSGPKR